MDAASLTSKVMTSLLAKLEAWGNGISEDHHRALQVIAYSFAQDVFRGDSDPERLAIGLDTGLGKTALLITFLNTLRQEQILYPVLVCVPNYKAMKEFMDGLLEVHSPDEVGCRFTPGEKSRDAGLTIEPVKDDELESCRVVLACHARADSSRGDWDKLVQVNEGKRAVYYDEALKRGQVHASRVKELREDFDMLKPYLSESIHHELEAVLSTLETAGPDDRIELPFNGLTLKQVQGAIRSYNENTTRKQKPTFEIIKPVVSGRYKFLRHGNGDFFSFENTLPEMQSLFVLDANHPFSVLSQLDESVQPIRIEQFKTFEQVAFKAYDGEISVRKILKAPARYIQWAADLVAETKAEGKNPAIICFKDMEPKVKEAIPGVTVIKWGMHAGSNECADKDALICIGVLRLSNEVTKGHITLHKNDLAGSVDGYQQIAAAEAALNLYQAVSRGQSRMVHVVDGKTVAKPSTIYLSGPLRKPQIALLQQVMPGCTYTEIKHPEVVAAIKEYFRSYPFDDEWDPTISIAKLKKDVQSLSNLTDSDMSHIYTQLIGEGWHKTKRSLRAPFGLNGIRSEAL